MMKYLHGTRKGKVQGQNRGCETYVHMYTAYEIYGLLCSVCVYECVSLCVCACV